MKKKFSIFIVFLFVCLTSYADVYEGKTNLEVILNQLPQTESIKCKFRQVKTLKNIEKPVISSGDFEFKKGEGVYFYTTYPVKSNVNYTNKNYKQINDVLNAISNKKYAKLEKEFDFYYKGNKSNWKLILKPKNINTSEYLSDIKIEGSDYIKKINIVQTNGNKTELWFEKEGL